MNKLFTKIAGLGLGLALAIGVGAAIGSESGAASRVDANSSNRQTETTTFSYKNDSTDCSGSSNKGNVFSTNYFNGTNTLSLAVSGNPVKTYCGSTSGLRLGTGSANGSITFTVGDAYKNNVKKVTVNTGAYGSDSTTFDLTINGTLVADDISAGNSASGTYASNTTINSISIATSGKRIYVSSIEIQYQPAVTYTSLVADTTGATKTVYKKGETFNTAGIVVKAYDGSSQYSAALTAGTDFDFSPANGDTLNTAGTQVVSLTGKGSYNGLSGSFNVTVNDLEHPWTANPTLALTPNQNYIYSGKEASLAVTTTPSVSDEEAVVTSSNNTALAVSGTGPYTLTAGEVNSDTSVTVTVAGKEGVYSSTTTLTVKPNTVTVTLDKTSYTKLAFKVGDGLAHTGITASGQHASGDTYIGDFAWSYYIGGNLVTTVPDSVGTDIDMTVRATASDNSYAETTVKIDITYAAGKHPSTAFTVSEAIAKIDAGAGSDFWYVKGYVDGDAETGSSGDFTFYLVESISDIGDQNSDYLLAYYVGPNTTDSAAPKTGDYVVLKAVLTYYAKDGIYETKSNSGSFIYSIERESITSVEFADSSLTFTSGDKFSFSKKASVTYAHQGTIDNVGSGFTYAIGSTAVTANTTMTRANNGQTLTVTYTDDSGRHGTAEFTLVVNYKPTTSVTLDVNEATLYKNDLLELTATVSDQYALPSVKWLTSDDSIVDAGTINGNTAIFESFEKAGTATITAYSDENGNDLLDTGEKNDTCAVTVIIDRVLEIDQTSMEVYTGADSAVINVTKLENFVSNPIVTWASTDEDVAIVEGDASGATVVFGEAGTATISLNVKDDNEEAGVSVTCDVTVGQSAVTALTLSSSITPGDLYVGESLTLTPHVSVVGNANKTVDWVSDDESVATVSSDQTTNEGAITVTAVGEGSTTITAMSDYSGGTTQEATFDVTVSVDTATVSWSNRGDQIFTVGDKFALKSGASLSVDFANPRVSDLANLTPTSTGIEVLLNGTAINVASYTFTKADNGKSIAIRYTKAGYEATTTEASAIRVVRSIVDGGTLTGTVTIASSAFSYDGKAGALANNYPATGGGYTNFNTTSIRLASNGNNGSVTVKLADTTAKIESITVSASAYDSGAKVTITSGSYSSGQLSLSGGKYSTGTIDSSKQTYEFTITAASKNRIDVTAISFVVSSAVDKSQSSEALALDTFINTYMHMDDAAYNTEEYVGLCDAKDPVTKQTPYTLAKAAFNALGATTKQFFIDHKDSAYAAEYARLAAWAESNGDIFNASNELVKGAIGIGGLFVDVNNSASTVIIIIASVIGLTAIGGYFLFKKKRQ